MNHRILLVLCCYTFRRKHVNITGQLSKLEKHFLLLQKNNNKVIFFASFQDELIVLISGQRGVFLFVFFSLSKYLPSNNGHTHKHTCMHAHKHARTHMHTICATVCSTKSVCRRCQPQEITLLNPSGKPLFTVSSTEKTDKIRIPSA